MSKVMGCKWTAIAVAMALAGVLALSGCGRKDEAPASGTGVKEEAKSGASPENVLTNLTEGRIESMRDPVYQAKLNERLDGRREHLKAIAEINARLVRAQEAEQPDAEAIAGLEAELKAARDKFADYEKQSKAIVYERVQRDLRTR